MRPGDRGWWPNQGPIGAVANTVLAGSNVCPRGPGKLSAFPGHAAAAGLAGDTMMPVGNTFAAIGTGSVVYYRQETYWYEGSGNVSVGNTSIGVASPNLKFIIGLAGTPITAGLTAPSQPLLELNGSGPMSGTYSVKICYKRSASGAVSNASIASAVVSCAGNKLKLTVPAPGAGAAGADRVRVYVTARGFGLTGTWRFLSEHTISPTAATVITALGPNGTGAWADGDRGTETAPFENDPPPAGTHCCVLGSVMMSIGCYGGAGVAFSFAAKPESYSPDRVTFLPGPVVGIAPRPSDGFAYVWGTNYLAALVLVPGGVVIPRLIWSGIGLPNPDAGCLVESEFWCYDGEPVRTTQAGDPDTSFALAVRDYMRQNWTTANVVVGYSQRDNAVVFFHGSECVAYFRALDAWSTPLTCPGSVRAAVSVGDELRFAPGTSGLQAFGRGTGTSWFAVTEFRDGGTVFQKTVRNAKTSCSGAVDWGILTNLNQVVLEDAQSIPAGGDQHGEWLRTDIKNVESYAFRYSGTGLQNVYQTYVDGNVRGAYV